MCWPDTSDNGFNYKERSLWILFFTRCVITSSRPCLFGARPYSLFLRVLCLFDYFILFYLMTSCVRNMTVISYLFSLNWPCLADPTAVYINTMWAHLKVFLLCLVNWLSAIHKSTTVWLIEICRHHSRKDILLFSLQMYWSRISDINKILLI